MKSFIEDVIVQKYKKQSKKTLDKLDICKEEKE